jgi:hypothetical protein
MPSSPRLSKNTKVIEVSVSNRNNKVMDVRKVMDNEGQEGIQFYIPRSNKSRTGMHCK